MSDFTGAVNAIDEKIQYHSGKAQEHRRKIEHHEALVRIESSGLDAQEKEVESLKAARKVLTDAETTSRKQQI